MVDGCLRRGVHYLDITGEGAVFAALARRDAEARAAGVTLLPGVGFDVVPSDGLAAHLARRLPGASRLTLALKAIDQPSRGTTLTMLEGIHLGGMIRRGGKLTRVPSGWRTRALRLRPRAGRLHDHPLGRRLDRVAHHRHPRHRGLRGGVGGGAGLRRGLPLARPAARVGPGAARPGVPGPRPAHRPGRRGPGPWEVAALRRGGARRRPARRGAAGRARGVRLHGAWPRSSAPSGCSPGRRAPASSPPRSPSARTSRSPSRASSGSTCRPDAGGRAGPRRFALARRT